MLITDRLNLSSKRQYSDEGFLLVPARISRTGIQNYLASEMGLTDREPNDIIKVFRPKDEVFNQDSLASFANKPVTDNHPPELVTAKNSKKYTVGQSGNDVSQDNDYVQTILSITDGDAITKIESGKVELSNGYTSDIDWTPGVTPSGEAFDAVQRNIRGNHIAIVERGRAGPACKVADNLPNKPNEDKSKMTTITIDGVDFEGEKPLAQAVGKLQARLKDAEEMTEKEKEEKKKKEDEFEAKEKEAKKSEDTLNAKLDDAKAKILSTTDLDKLVAERATLVDCVNKVCPSIKWEGKDAATLKKEVVATKYPNVQFDSKSEDYINARFDMLTEDISSVNAIDSALTKQLTNINDSTGEIELSDGDKAYKSYQERNRNAWKGGDK